MTATLPRARSRDPQTSHQAAERAKVFAPTHAQLIYDVLTVTNMTASEIADCTRLTVVQVCRRLPEIDGLTVVTRGGIPLERDGFRVWGIV